VKLSVKYSATILSLVFAIVIAFASVILIQSRSHIARLNASSAETLRQSVLKEIQAKEANSVRVMASALTNPLYQLDMLKINELVAAVKQQPDVLYIYVFDEKRRIVHDGTKDLLAYDRVLDDQLTVESIRTARSLTGVDGDAFHISVPIWIQDELVGGVKVGYSMKRILSDIVKQEQDLGKNYQFVAGRQLNTIGILAFVFSIGGLLVAVFVARSWTKPIIQLSNLAARVGQGDYDVSIPINRTDEIGSLASSFNDMAESLKKLRDKDVAQSEELREANSELRRTNEELTHEVAERQQAEKEVIEQNRRMQLLHEIDSAISSTLDRRILLEALFDKIESLLPYSAITVRLVDKETNRLVPVSARNLDLEAWKKGLQDHAAIDGQGFSQTIFQKMQPVEIENVQTDPRCWNQELFRQHGLVSYVGVPIIAEGAVLGVLGFYTADEHRFAKEETEFLATLAGQVAIGIYNSELYWKIKNQAAELERANKAKDEFLSVMSHELRTPLNVINGYAEILSEGVLGEVQDEQVHALKTIDLQAKELLRMINEVLQVGSLEAGKVVARIEDVDLQSLIAEIRTGFDVLSKKTIPLFWNVPADLPMARTDREKLKHIIQNLIHNAIKFTEEGSITISAHCLQESFQVEVQDSGIGMAEEDRAMIFQMFRQLDSSGTRTYGGAGVGLYIVKKFVELLNGSIAVKSAEGKGSTFTVTVPMDVAAMRAWNYAAAG